MPRGERQRHHAAHRGAGDQRLVPAELGQHVGDVVGELLDRIGPRRLVGRAMAAAVEGDDGGIVGEPLRHRLPELAVHCDRMHERRTARRRGVTVQGVGNADAVAGAGTAIGTGGAAKIGVQRKPLWNAAG